MAMVVKPTAIEVVKEINDLPTLPEVAVRAIAAAQNPYCTSRDLQAIISHDPAMAARVVKMANSAFYGQSGPVASVERAVVVLGLTTVKNIAVATSLAKAFLAGSKCDSFTAKDVWIHCVAVAATARALTRRSAPTARAPAPQRGGARAGAGTALPEEDAFLAGLLHDLGLLVSLRHFPEELSRICEGAASGGDFCQLERTLIGATHQHMGSALARHWRLPEPCRMVALHHHSPLKLAPEDRRLPALIYVADTICCRSRHGFNLTAAPQPLNEAELAAALVDPEVAQSVTADLDSLVSAATVLFQ